MSKYLVFLLLFCFLENGNAQDSTHVKSSSIESFTDKLIVKLNVDTRTDTYTILNRENGSRMSIAPNINTKLYASVDYQFIGFSFGYSPPIFPENNKDDSKGESSFRELKCRAVIGQWIQGFHISNTKGYYIESISSSSIGKTVSIENYLLPDFQSRIYGMSTSYVFNSNFSFRNLLSQTEWQKKSEGSFIPTLFYSYDKFTYTLEDQEVKNEIFPVTLSIAYYYTWVIKNHWFVGGNLSPSVGINFSKSHILVDDIETKDKSTEYSKAVQGSLQVGYASKKVVFGGGVTFDVNDYDVDSKSTLLNDKTYGFVYLGYRFNAPRFLDKSYKSLARKFGF